MNENENQSENRIHHPYSPSTLQSLEACPCYEGTQTEHVRSIAGTKAHKVTETLVDDNSLSDEDAEAAAECVDFYNQRKQLLEDDAYNEGRPVLELQESYLPIDDEEFEEYRCETNIGFPVDIGALHKFKSTTAGYFDRAVFSHDGTYCEAFDWKFGIWAIEKCSNNLQAIAYVLGLFKKFPALESIRFFFKQPALQVVSEHLFARSDIPALYLRVKVVVARAREARARKDFGTANPTIPGCLFCRHIGVCPKVTDFACRVGTKFAPLKIPANITPSMVQDPQNTGLGMQLAQVVKVWAEAFRSVTADRVLRGAPLPEGYELQSREGSRKVSDPFKFKVRALEAGLTEEDFQATTKYSLGAVEKAIGDKAERGSKKHAIQAFKVAVESDNAVERGAGCCFLQAKNGD